MRTAWLLITALLLAGCSKKPEATSAAEPAPAAGAEQGAGDAVIIPVNSPKLKEIRVGEVKTAAVPFDEVVSPGKIEANPNLVSRVALPLPGRVSAVMVKLG